MIEFQEDRCSNYQHRTFANVDQSEVTLAFAVDFNTAGEKCTMNFCKTCQRPFFAFKVNDNGKIDKECQRTLDDAYDYIFNKEIKDVNIAGNGIYTFNKHGISQERLNEMIYNLLNNFIDRGCTIKTIRSGGQTGADEAGLVAAEKLGLNAICLCPKGWRFRPANGKDIYSEELFKSRFN